MRVLLYDKSFIVAGLIFKWKYDTTMSFGRKLEKIPVTVSSSHLGTQEHFLRRYKSPFLIYILGNSLALFVFIVEILYDRIKRRSKRNDTLEDILLGPRVVWEDLDYKNE